MRIRLHGEDDLTVEALLEPGFEVESDPGIHAHFSAMEMFAASFALCSANVLMAYAEQTGDDPDDLSLRIRWSYLPNPLRIGAIELSVHWPSLPPGKRLAAERAAKQCTIHHTLEDPPNVVSRFVVEGAAEEGEEEIRHELH